MSPTVDSDGVNPGRHALVESESRSFTPPERFRDRAHEREVGLAAVDRGGVELEVAAVHDRARGRVVGGGERVRHRVRDGDELAVERTDQTAFAVVHRDQLGAAHHPGFLDAVAGEPERQRRAVDRERDVAQQEGETAGVVLVRVGEEGGFDPVGVLAEVGEVGQHEVDPGHVALGEHDPAVDDEDAVFDLETEAVAPDLAETAEEDDPDRRGAHPAQATGVSTWAVPSTCARA